MAAIYRPFKLHCLHKKKQMKAMPSWSSALAFAAQWWYGTTKRQNISPISAVIFAGCIGTVSRLFLFTNIFGLFSIRFGFHKYFHLIKYLWKPNLMKKKPKYICKQKKLAHSTNTSCKNNCWYWGNILTLDGTAVLFTKMYFDTDVNPIFGHFKRSIPLPSHAVNFKFQHFYIWLVCWYRLIIIEALEPNQIIIEFCHHFSAYTTMKKIMRKLARLSLYV